METRIMFLIILLLCLWLIFSKRGRQLTDALKNNILNQVFGDEVEAAAVTDE